MIDFVVESWWKQVNSKTKNTIQILALSALVAKWAKDPPAPVPMPPGKGNVRGVSFFVLYSDRGW